MQQLQQLIENSLHISKGMEAYWSNTGRVQELDPTSYVKRLNGKVFAVAGYRVIGYMMDGEMYVTPYTKDAVQTLRNNGYKEYAFFVPLSPPEMTLVDEDLATKWQSLLDQVTPRKTAVA